jgi:hypothetical protein
MKEINQIKSAALEGRKVAVDEIGADKKGVRVQEKFPSAHPLHEGSSQIVLRWAELNPVVVLWEIPLLFFYKPNNLQSQQAALGLQILSL